MPFALGIVQDELEGMFRGMKGVEYKRGRLPDPAVPLAEATPGPWNVAAEDQRASDMANLAIELMRILQVTPPLTVALMRDVVLRPSDFNAAFARIAQDRTATGMLAILLTNYLERADRVARQLLALPDLQSPDEELIREGNACIQAGCQLLQSTLALVNQAMAADGNGRHQDAGF